MATSIFGSNANQDRKTVYYRMLIKTFMYNGGLTIPEISKLLQLSIPTITKIVNELMAKGYVREDGKRDSVHGRFPAIYNLSPDSGYFLGVSPGHDSLDMAICDFSGNCIDTRMNIPFVIENSPECLEQLVDHIRDYIETCPINKSKILQIGMNIPGRVNPFQGLSYSFFNFIEKPLASYLTDAIGYPVSIDNDTRAMAYGEFLQGCCKGRKNVIFVNVSWGIAIGIIINGELYFGNSSFSGEFGHIRSYDNEVLCHCGKKGCLETEVSGMAMVRETMRCLKNGERSILSDKIIKNEQKLTLKDILHAIKKEDTLCIDVLQRISDELGKNLAGMINLFNPEILVIGGDLSLTGDYITQPVSMAIKKYSLNMVNEDSKILTSTLGEYAGVIGACMIARYRLVTS